MAVSSQQLLDVELEFANLTKLRNRPNLLAALGATWSEIKHSNFLAYLFDTAGPHQLADRFLKAFLPQVDEDTDPRVEGLAEICELDLTETRVEREADNIDLLLLNPRERLAIIVENKTRTGEHDDQLRRYWDTVTTKYPWATRRVGLLLSVYGVQPSDSRFLGVGYSSVCAAGEKVIRSAGSSMPEWTRNYLAEYISAVRREFVGDPHILDLTWKLNVRFRDAVHFLNRNRPSDALRQKLSSLIERALGLHLERMRPERCRSLSTSGENTHWSATVATTEGMIHGYSFGFGCPKTRLTFF